MKVLVTGKIDEEHIEKIKSMGFDVELAGINELRSGNYPKDAEILCGSIALKKLDLRDFKNLKIILTYSVGVDYLDKNYLKEKGIILCNNKGAYAQPIGEWIIYNLLQIEKLNKENIKNQENKIWKRRNSSGTLYNKKILFLGTGDIASDAARKLQGFDMEVVGFNTDGRDLDYFNRCVDKTNLDKELASSDYIVVALPHTPATERFVNKECFDKMKDGVVIINISRGSTIDEAEMIRQLESGKIKAVALDVVEREPLSQDSPLWEMENVYITPHISDTSEDFRDRVLFNVMDNLKNIKEGKELINKVNFNKGY
ncbi:NAD(P)-dependent oxidoreductase [Peptoniphilus catoniae]|uniref:NAD(P)-dependent oxidoreductase n=1 Tax=Peptoniphilus catoniae TaxID=1660341 RepID=UPI0010FECA1D|nr:NAD(P)-dependent oxidoreductase [Peptoniphilus catoniae]